MDEGDEGEGESCCAVGNLYFVSEEWRRKEGRKEGCHTQERLQ